MGEGAQIRRKCAATILLSASITCVEKERAPGGEEEEGKEVSRRQGKVGTEAAEEEEKEEEREEEEKGSNECFTRKLMRQMAFLNVKLLIIIESFCKLKSNEL